MGVRIEIIEFQGPKSLSFETAFQDDTHGVVKAPCRKTIKTT